MLTGYKTYIIAAAGIIWAGVGYYFGTLDVAQALMVLQLSGASAALRNGIGK